MRFTGRTGVPRDDATYRYWCLFAAVAAHAAIQLWGKHVAFTQRYTNMARRVRNGRGGNVCVRNGG